MSEQNLLSVRELRKWFELRKGLFGKAGYVKAVDGVSFDLNKGDAISLVGESGSGKTTLGKTILRLYKPTSGQILFEGKDITNLKPKQLMSYREETGLVQQDPYGALPPFMSIQRILEEPLAIHKIGSSERTEKVYKALEEVRLTPIEDFVNKYPHMLSGGQQQRLVIARAMILNPKFIVADEPVSMLDASVRIEILTLLKELQRKHGLGVIYITHDLSTTRYFSEWIYIMYAGKIVEKAPTKTLLKNPVHPYSRALLNIIPDPDAENRFKLKEVPPGEPPSLVNPPEGCRFHPRCLNVKNGICNKKEPEEIEIEKDHFVRCWRYA
ncbi:MAG: ABC transporter ATP-binding protein [Candidatus Bathyarchaeota archaeon]|jgi:peptide/nickel transport system ATP-binding protein|nr:ABC transporter ATP-binding protein [Candidatus Bathyarchaeota archaeon]